MLTYLLRKPMEYCSHSFVPLFLETQLRSAVADVYRRVSPATAETALRAEGGNIYQAKWKPLVGPSDYDYRPAQLEQFPLYFCMAGCDACSASTSAVGHWVQLYATPAGVTQSVPGGGGSGTLTVRRQRSFVPEPV